MSGSDFCCLCCCCSVEGRGGAAGTRMSRGGRWVRGGWGPGKVSQVQVEKTQWNDAFNDPLSVLELGFFLTSSLSQIKLI